MAKKRKQEKRQHEPTKRQRSRWKQQKRRQRIIMSIAIAIVVALLCVVGVGVYNNWYVKDYKPLHETVIEVNGTEFDMEYYITMLGYYTQGMSSEYVSYFTGYVTELIESNELIRQEAAALGISVSDEEVDELMESVELEEDYRDIAVTQLLLEKVRDNYLDQQIPQSAEQRYIMAMFLEGEAQAEEVIDRIEDGESFSDIAAELSLDDTTQEAAGDLGWLTQEALLLTVDSTVLEEAAFDLDAGTLSEPIFDETKTRDLGYWLVEVAEVIEAEEEDGVDEAYVLRMLLSSEQEALDISARLEDGEDFAELAAEFSQDTATNTQGGTITIAAGATTTAFDDYVFDPEVELGVLSPPIRDEEVSLAGGYWLIEVTEAEDDRQIDEEQRDMLKTAALDEWVTGLMEDPDNDIVDNLDEEKLTWAIAHITGG